MFVNKAHCYLRARFSSIQGGPSGISVIFIVTDNNMLNITACITYF